MEQQHHNIIMNIKDLTIGYRSRNIKSTFTYGPINQSVRSGDLIAVIGRNGIGKSSLLRTMALLQNPLKGNIILLGKVGNSYSRNKLAQIMSYVSTETVGMQNFKVYEMISLGRSPYTNWWGKLNIDDHRIIENAINQAQIWNLSSKFMHQLSDGERQKVMIARALAQDTPVIILDEPTAFLDLPARYDILRLMNKLTLETEKTIIFSTHDLDIAMHEADRIWLMLNDGIVDGAPEDLLFKQQFHKLFLNSPLEYDFQSDGFRLKKEVHQKIGLKGKKDYFDLTIKALKRIGFQVVYKDVGKINIEVVSESDEPVWILEDINEGLVFKSIYELITYLKNNYKQKLWIQ